MMGGGQQIRKSSNRIEVSKPEQAFYACVDAFVYWYDMSYKTDSFGYKTTLDATSATKAADPSTAKAFFDQKVQEDCKKQGTEVKNTHPEISNELFNSYQTDQDFWLKKGSLPTTKQQRALNELTHSQLDCIKTKAHQFTITSNTNFYRNNILKPIEQFETLFTSAATSCGAPENKIKKILQTYTDNNSTQKAVMYFYLISYLTTELFTRQELFQKIKVMEGHPNNSTCDDFSSHIDSVLRDTHLFNGKLIIGTQNYLTKTAFKDAGTRKIKTYNSCQPSRLMETNYNLESLFHKYYVEGKGLTQLTRTLSHKISTPQERRAGVGMTVQKLNETLNTATTNKHKYFITRFPENISPPPSNPACKQKYCLRYGTYLSQHVWLDQNNILIFQIQPQNKQITLFVPAKQTLTREKLIDIELFIEDYVYM